MDFIAKFPRKLPASAKADAPSYELVSDLYAVHRERAGLAQGAELLLDEGKIAIFKVEANSSRSAAPEGNLSAVYRLTPGGSLAVPTGRIFIRFAEGLEVGASQEALSQAGYEVTETLAYAQNAAWLQTRSGDIADSLNGLAGLKELPNVESVEPQMLMESVRR